MIGILIVLVSVALGARTVAAADDTIPVFAAATTLPSGRSLDGSDVRIVRVHLDEGAAAYLSARHPLPSGLVLERPVGAGELLPVGALGASASFTRRAVTVPLPTAVPAGLRPGSAVDLWSSAKDAGGETGGGYEPPVRIAAGAEVFSVTTSDSSLGATDVAQIQLLLDEQEVPAVLDAVANDAKLAVVPAPGVTTATVESDGSTGSPGADSGGQVGSVG